MIILANDVYIENIQISSNCDYSLPKLMEAMNFINRYCVRQSFNTIQEPMLIAE